MNSESWSLSGLARVLGYKARRELIPMQPVLGAALPVQQDAARTCVLSKRFGHALLVKHHIPNR